MLTPISCPAPVMMATLSCNMVWLSFRWSRTAGLSRPHRPGRDRPLRLLRRPEASVAGRRRAEHRSTRFADTPRASMLLGLRPSSVQVQGSTVEGRRRLSLIQGLREAAFGVGSGQPQSLAIGLGRVERPFQAAEQIGSGGSQQVVAGQRAVSVDGREKLQPSFGPLDHRDRDRRGARGSTTGEGAMTTSAGRRCSDDLAQVGLAGLRPPWACAGRDGRAPGLRNSWPGHCSIRAGRS